MDSMARIFMDRARNELYAAGALKKLSEDDNAKVEFQVPLSITFYSAVISHAYYAIFYSAKAVLLAKGITTESPEIHKKTYDSFEKHLVATGEIDARLLQMYRTIVVRADYLLGIFKDEKWKRGNYTYNTIPQANMEPAEDSLRNAKDFVAHMEKMA